MTLHVKNPSNNMPMPVLGRGGEFGGAIDTVRPVDIYGTVTVGEVNSTITSPTATVLNFPSGLLGFTLDFFAPDVLKNISPGVVAATEMYVAFNNTALNDVGVAGLRYVVKLGDSFIKAFNDQGVLPTQVTFIPNAAEATQGDSRTIWQAAAR